MPRIRTIKPEFFSSPDVEGMSPWARLLYIAMWNFADDAGRGSALPRELAGFAFPRDNFDSADIRRVLGEVRRGFGVTFYKVNGRPYYCIPTWSKHQKIDKRSTPKYPAPGDGQEYDPEAGARGDTPVDQPEHDSSAGSTEDSAEPAEDPPSTRRSLGAGNRNRGTGEIEPPLPSVGEEGCGEEIEPADSKAARTSRGPTPRGSRLPDDFTVTPELAGWAREHVPDVDIETETAQFCDHFKGESSSKGIKRDWPATWRKWMRKEQQMRQDRARSRAHRNGTRPNGMTLKDERIAKIAALDFSTDQSAVRELPTGEAPW